MKEQSKICANCSNMCNGVCKQFGANYFDHVCQSFEGNSLTAKLLSQTRVCFCEKCNENSAILVDVQEGILLYKCEKCGKTYTYSIDELK